jgi:hypothetical protein
MIKAMCIQRSVVFIGMLILIVLVFVIVNKHHGITAPTIGTLIEPSSTNPTRHPQWLVQGDNLFLVWEIRNKPIALTGLDRFTEHRMRYLKYGLVAIKGNRTSKSMLDSVDLPIKRYPTNIPYPHYRIAYDKDKLKVVYDVSTGSGLYGPAIQIASIHASQKEPNDKLEIMRDIRWFPPRKTGKYPHEEDMDFGCAFPSLEINQKKWVLAWESMNALQIAVSNDAGTYWTRSTRFADGASFPAVALTDESILLTAHGMDEPFYHPGSDSIIQGWKDDTDPPSEKNRPVKGKLLFWRIPIDLNNIPVPTILDHSNTVVGSDIAVTGNQVCVVYSKGHNPSINNASIWIIKSTDGGNTWGKATKITDGKAIDRDPCITVYRNAYWIAFTRTTIDKKNSIQYISMPLQ